MAFSLRLKAIWAFTALVCLFILPIHCLSQVKSVTPTQKREKPGKIAGLVINLSTGEPLPKAGIEVVSTGQIVYTDTDGNFTLELQAGTYELRAFHTDFIETRKEITVSPADVLPVDIVLSQQGSGDVVEVKAGPVSDQVALLEERKAGNTISELVGRSEISKDTSSDAAGILQRVPGLSVAGNKFVFVRGLGDRYSNTVLNDALMPTPQPDRRVVPLDQVPSSLVQSFKVLKTFTPDQPGEFAGGLVKIETIEFPNGSSFKISSSFSGNTETTFQDYLSYPGSRFDFLGFGLGRRGIPSVIPDQRVRRGSQLISGFSTEDLQRFGRSFENVWEPRKKRGPLNQGYNAAASTQLGKLGIVGTLTYGYSAQRLDEKQNYYRVASDSSGKRVIIPQNIYDYRVDSNNVRLGAILTASYKINSNNKLLLKNFFSNDAVDDVRIAQGRFDDRGTDIFDQRIRYQLTRTSTNQVAGDHILSKLGNSILTWRFTYSRATLDDPDLRQSRYELDPTLGRLVYFETAQTGLRQFSEMRENIREPAADLSKFFFTGSSTINIKIGFSNSNRDRKFNSRRLRFLPRGFDGVDRSASPEHLYSAEYITPDRFEIFEDTRPTDFYVASQDITAGYAMGDLTMKKWRFIGGVRFERSRQDVRTFDPFSIDAKPIVASLDNRDPLPAAGVVYNLTSEVNIRAGYSKTVSRPQFRELSPFQFTEIVGGRETQGNPDLKRARIHNFDLRTEWYQKTGGLLAVSFFYKNLIDPIETVVEATTALRTSFRNVESAANRGLELEFRENIGRFTSRLSNLSLVANYTFVDSKIKIGKQDLSILTSLERPLSGQSRHLINLAIDYEITRWKADLRALFNYTGSRISDVGSVGIPDTIEKGYPALDLQFTKRLGVDGEKWELKLSGENLLNHPVRFTVDNKPFEVYRRGRTFSFGLSYTFF
jgi:outer membrane receptor protein involved in Fe transport